MIHSRVLRFVFSVLSTAGLLPLVGCGRQQAPDGPGPVSVAPKPPSEDKARPSSAAKPQERPSVPVIREPVAKAPPQTKEPRPKEVARPSIKVGQHHDSLLVLHEMIRPRTG